MFNAVGLERLKDMIHDVKKSRARTRPAWIIDDGLWQTMCRHWDTADAKKRSQTYSQNRMSKRDGHGISKHFGGSKSFDQHETDLSAEAGHPVGIHEVFRKTHFKDGKYSDGLSEKVDKAFEEQREMRQSQVDPELDSDGRSVVPPLTLDQEDEIFIQTTQTVRPSSRRPYGVPKRRVLDYGASSSGTRPPAGWTAMAEKVAMVEERNAKLEEEMAHIRLLLAHPEFQRLASQIRAPSPSQPSDASQDPPAPNPP